MTHIILCIISWLSKFSMLEHRVEMRDFAISRCYGRFVVVFARPVTLHCTRLVTLDRLP